MWLRRTIRSLKRALIVITLLLLFAGVLLIPKQHDRNNKNDDYKNRVKSFVQTEPSSEELDSVAEAWTETVPLETPDKRPWYTKEGERRPTDEDRSDKLFPEDAFDDDRITNQLMYTLTNDDDAKVKRILLANGVSAWGSILDGRREFVKNKCPVDKCELTSDMRLAPEADAVIFKDRYYNWRHKRPMNQIWILYYLECPFHTPSLLDEAVSLFNWTATYRRDSDIVAPYEKWVYYDPPPPVTSNTERNYAFNKTKKVAWFVSNCHARNTRLQYARQLSKHIPVDIYGACGTKRCPRYGPQCMQMLDTTYKFYLAFENSNCQDYITEKFFVNGLGRDILPIVMGARESEYRATAPHNSYIHVEDFDTPKDLADYLNKLDADDNLYNAYFKWKGKGEFINTYFWCRVCAMLHASDQRQRKTHYNDVASWWRSDTCTLKFWKNDETIV